MPEEKDVITTERSPEERFMGRLFYLDQKKRAFFKRSLGKTLHETDAATKLVFYEVMPPDVPVKDEDKWFFAACVSCQWPTNKKGFRIELPRAAGVHFFKSGSESIKQRFEKILGLKWDPSGPLIKLLSESVKILTAADFKIDAEKLLLDLESWDWTDADDPNRRAVQKSWIRKFYNKDLKKDAKKKAEEETLKDAEEEAN